MSYLVVGFLCGGGIFIAVVLFGFPKRWREARRVRQAIFCLMSEVESFTFGDVMKRVKLPMDEIMALGGAQLYHLINSEHLDVTLDVRPKFNVYRVTAQGKQFAKEVLKHTASN